MYTKASLAILLMVSIRGQAQSCVDNTFSCSSCTALNACFEGILYPITCPAGQICGNDGINPSIDRCFDASDSTNIKRSQCACDPAATDPSFIADGLSDSNKAYLACLPGSSAPESLVCTVGFQIFLEGQNPPCGDFMRAPTTFPPTTTTPATTLPPFECYDAGFFRDYNFCGKYWLCQGANDYYPTEGYCAAGETFDQVTVSCIDPCDPSVATFNCDGFSGAVPDSKDCSIFHICVNGAVVGEPVPCPAGESFFSPGQYCSPGYHCSAADLCMVCPTGAPQIGSDSITEQDHTTASGADSAIDVSDEPASGSDTTSGSGSLVDESESSEGNSDTDKGELSLELNIHVQLSHPGSDQEQNQYDFFQNYKAYEN